MCPHHNFCDQQVWQVLHQTQGPKTVLTDPPIQLTVVCHCECIHRLKHNPMTFSKPLNFTGRREKDLLKAYFMTGEIHRRALTILII